MSAQVMLVQCPGCAEPVEMPAAMFGKGHAGSGLHKCPVLGPMPDPFDPAALMDWASGLLAPQPTPTVEPVNATLEKPKRQRVHVPFDDVVCPVPGCQCRHRKCGEPGHPVHGKVPGVHRHIWFMHREVYEQYSKQLPPNRTIDGLISAFEKDEEAAQRLIDSLNLRALLPKDDDGWTWEDAAAAVLNKVEEKS